MHPATRESSDPMSHPAKPRACPWLKLELRSFFHLFTNRLLCDSHVWKRLLNPGFLTRYLFCVHYLSMIIRVPSKIFGKQVGVEWVCYFTSATQNAAVDCLFANTPKFTVGARIQLFFLIARLILSGSPTSFSSVGRIEYGHLCDVSTVQVTSCPFRPVLPCNHPHGRNSF